MKKHVAFALFYILAAFTAFGSGKLDHKAPGKTPTAVHVAALAGPSGIGMARLMSAPPTLGDSVPCEFEIAGSVDVLLPKLVNGDADIGILPPNVAAKLYNANPDSILAAAIVGNGMISLVTRDEGIASLEDLAGKTVSVAGQGATPEYVLRALLSARGMPADSVTTDFSVPVPEIAAALVSDKIQYALLPEPFATVAVLNGKNGTSPVAKALSMKELWSDTGFGDDFPMTLCVVRADFARDYPELLREFLGAYRQSIEWTVANPAEAGALSEKAGFGLKAAIATKAIPSSNYVYIDAKAGKASIESLLSVFLEYAPAAVGGKLPDDNFYFK